MEKLLEILNTLNANIDYMTETRLIDDGYLDSLLILALVGELENTFEIEITPVDLIPANFNSAEAIWNLIQRLQEEN